MKAKPTHAAARDIRDITRARNLAVAARDDIQNGRKADAIGELDKLLLILGPMLDARTGKRQVAYKAKPKAARR